MLEFVIQGKLGQGEAQSQVSIAKRVNDAFEKLMRNDAEGALFAICSAIEETARREGRPKGRRGYKEFIADNIHLLTGIGLGHPVAGLAVAYTHPELPASQNGTARIEDIIYHVVRCALYHTAALPDTVHLTDNTIGPDTNGDLLLPKALVLGLIVAVVTSPGNVDEKTNPGFCFTAFGENFVLNDLWGKRVEVTQRVLDAAQKRDRTQVAE